MAGNFTKQATTAKRLIIRNGQDLAFKRDTTAFDEVLGGPAVPATYTEWDGYGVRLTNYKGVSFEGMDDAFKAALTTGKATILLVAASGLDYPPAPGDEVTLGDGSIWFVKGINMLNPAGQPILYTLGVVSK